MAAEYLKSQGVEEALQKAVEKETAIVEAQDKLLEDMGKLSDEAAKEDSRDRPLSLGGSKLTPEAIGAIENLLLAPPFSLATVKMLWNWWTKWHWQRVQ